MPEQRNESSAAKGSDKCLVCNRPRSEHINGQLCTRWDEAVKSAASSRPPSITADDINSYFVHDDGSVWRVVTYAATPTATLECVYGRASVTDVKPRVGGCVGAPIFVGFRKLVPEETTR